MSHFGRANVCLLRFFAAVSAFALLVCTAFSLTACADNKKETGGGNGGPIRPLQYREGYTTEHKGYLPLPTVRCSMTSPERCTG